jgi:anti-sigma factor RsiW
VSESVATPVLTCDDIVPLLPMVADGVIDDQNDPAVFDHLARCSECQDALMRHDLVTMSIECGNHHQRLAPPRTWQVRLPWPVGLAATLAFAGLTFELTSYVSDDKPQVVADRVQVYKITSANSHHVIYQVVQDGQVTPIDPHAIDGAMPHEERGEVHSVKSERVTY